MSSPYFTKAKFDNENAELKNKSCILLVSTGQKYHEGERLAATVDLINKSHFSSCVIAVADTLQRHNFHTMPTTIAYQHGLQTGDEWIARNADVINTLIPKTKILRWDTALQNIHYAGIKEKLDREYVENPAYRDAINDTIAIFTDRVKKRDTESNIDNITANCLTYLLEECPIIMPLWALEGYDFIIYPKPMTKAMAMTREIFVEQEYPNKAQWLALKFKKLSMPVNERQMTSQQLHLIGNYENFS
jgi:hypothetical protein